MVFGLFVWTKLCETHFNYRRKIVAIILSFCCVPLKEKKSQSISIELVLKSEMLKKLQKLPEIFCLQYFRIIYYILFYFIFILYFYISENNQKSECIFSKIFYHFFFLREISRIVAEKLPTFELLYIFEKKENRRASRSSLKE